MSRIHVRAAFLALLAVLAAGPAAAIDLQAHRGGRGLWPENTLPAFVGALSLGVSTLELDTGVSRDGVVVVAHDPVLLPDLTRGADGAWLAAPGPALRALDLADIKRYDVGRLRPGSAYAARYPEQVAVDRTTIPTLVEVLDLVERSGNRRVALNIEIKTDPRAPERTMAPEDFARLLVETLRQAGMLGRATIQSFDWRGLQAVQRAAPEVATVYLSAQQRFLDNIRAGEPGPSPWTAGIAFAAHGSVPRMVKAAGGRVWSPFHRDLTDALLGEAKALGLRVVVWTVNDPGEMDRLIGRGVDGIITDRPDLLRGVMAARGLPLPAPSPVAP